MGKSSPPTPDYKGAAEATSASNAAATLAQTYANRPTLTTPWGTQTWDTSSTTDPSTGNPVTSWASNISLTPDQQSALDSQQAVQAGRSNAAQGFLSNALKAYGIDPSNPSAGGSTVDFSSLPQGGQTIGVQGLNTVFNGSGGQIGGLDSAVGGNAGTDWRGQAQAAVEALQAPQLAQQRSALETKLANQGITQGSEAWNNAMRTQGDNETRAGLAAIDSGRSEAAQNFSQAAANSNLKNSAQGQLYQQTLGNTAAGNAALSAGNTAIQGNTQQLVAMNNANAQTRQQALAELLTQRGLPLNELNALLTGQQVSMPTMPGVQQAGNSGGTNYSGAAQNQYGADLNSTNYSNGIASQIGGLAGSALSYFM